jgi:hypothetical protein
MQKKIAIQKKNQEDDGGKLPRDEKQPSKGIFKARTQTTAIPVKNVPAVMPPAKIPVPLLKGKKILPRFELKLSKIPEDRVLPLPKNVENNEGDFKETAPRPRR